MTGEMLQIYSIEETSVWMEGNTLHITAVAVKQFLMSWHFTLLLSVYTDLVL